MGGTWAAGLVLPCRRQELWGSAPSLPPAPPFTDGVVLEPPSLENRDENGKFRRFPRPETQVAATSTAGRLVPKDL